MRLHQLIEKVGKTPDIDAGISLAINMFPDRAKQFDFGDVTNIPGPEWKDLQEFAIELISAEKFSLPFPVITFSYKADEFDHSLLAFNDAPDRILLIAVLSWGSDKYAIVVGHVLLAEVARLGKWAVRLINASPKPSGKSEAVDYSKALLQQAQNLCAMICMIQASGIEIKTELEPHKLNLKRVAKGRPPIKEINTVLIRVGKSAVSVSGQDVQRPHASPRLHWRRGHLRKLSSGEVTVVRCCLVGNVNGGPSVPTDYTIKH